MAGASRRDDGLPAYDAAMMTQSLAFARFYEAARDACGQPKLVANWLMGEVSKRLNAEGRIDCGPVAAATLAALIGRIADGTVSNNAARQVFDALWSGESAERRRAHRGQGPQADERQRRARNHRRRGLAANPSRSTSTAPARTRPSTPWSARS
jgi:Asp-tRNA(Asn)/Glu-tRNA(Gln) amidotransferase B subunit